MADEQSINDVLQSLQGPAAPPRPEVDDVLRQLASGGPTESLDAVESVDEAQAAIMKELQSLPDSITRRLKGVDIPSRAPEVVEQASRLTPQELRLPGLALDALKLTVPAGEQFARGAGIGLAGAVDFITGGRTDIATQENPNPGPGPLSVSPLARRLLQKEPSNRLERAAGLIGEEFGASAPFTGATMALARRFRGMAGPVGSFLDRARTHTRLFLTEEAAAATGAGLGRVAAQAAAPDDPIVEVIGAIGGGIAAPVSLQALRLGGRTARGTAAAMSGRVTTRQSRETAIHRMSRVEKEALDSAVERSDLLRERFGIEPSLGALTGDPAVVALESELIRKNPDLARRFNLAMAEGKASVRRALAEKLPPSSTVEAARANARAATDRILAQSERRVAEEMDRLSDEARRLGVEVDPVALNRAAGKSLREAAEEETRRTAAAFDEIRELAQRTRSTVSSKKLKAARTDVMGKAGFFEKDLLPDSILLRIKKLGDRVDFAMLESLQRRLSAELFDVTKGRNPDRARARLLGFLKKGLDDTFDEFGTASSVDARVRDLHRAEREAFAEGAQRFRDGVSGDVLAHQSGLIDATLDSFFQAGKKSRAAAIQFRAAFRDNPQVLADMEDFIVKKAVGAVTEPDKMNPARLRAFKHSYSAALSEFPGAARRIESLASLADEARGFRLANPTPKRADLGAVGAFVDDPNRAVRTALRASDKEAALDQLFRQVGKDEASKAGFRRVLMDELFNRSLETSVGPSGVGPRVIPGISTSNLAEVVETNRGIIRRFFGQQHLDDLEEILGASATVDLIPTTLRTEAVRPPKASGLRNILPPATAPILTPRQRAIRVGIRLMRLFETAEDPVAIRMLEEAIADPRVARTLRNAETVEDLRPLFPRFGLNVPTAPRRIQDREAVQ